MVRRDREGDGGPSPLKLYYRIGEVASLVGVEPHVLRYWETEFRSIKPQKSRTGQRVYSRRDVERLIKVKELLYEQGFTIAGARKRLRETGAEPPAPDNARDRALVAVREELAQARAALVELLEELTLAEPGSANVEPSAASSVPVNTPEAVAGDEPAPALARPAGVPSQRPRRVE